MKKCISIILFVLMLLLLPITTSAATVTVYSDVLDDLKSDSSFDEFAYDYVANDYSLELIQIAESSDDELFIYVYQPGKVATATSINISTVNPENQAVYKVYQLTLLNTNEVFQKYKVNDLTVSDNAIRYYNISAIYREFVEGIDTENSDDNTTSEIAYTVGHQWYAYDTNNEVMYQMTYIETIEITTKHVGFIRYEEGFKLYYDACDSHYVAFNTDKKIERLIDADIYWVQRSKLRCDTTTIFVGTTTSYSYGDSEEKYTTLTNIDTASNDADGWFGKKYTWNRIESVSNFIANETLTEATKTALEDKAWILRFAETDYTISGYETVFLYNSVEITDVTILRLKFETDGVVYNLGVVDNRTLGDSNSDNIINPGKDKSLWEQFLEWFIENFPKSILYTLGGVIVVLTFGSLALGLIFKLIIAIITWPFKKILGL